MGVQLRSSGAADLDRDGYYPEEWHWRDPSEIPPGGFYSHGMPVPARSEAHEAILRARTLAITTAPAAPKLRDRETWTPDERAMVSRYSSRRGGLQRLAAALGVDRSTVGQWISGRKLPQRGALKVVMEVIA